MCLDFTKKELIWHTVNRIRDQHMIFNRVHVNTIDFWKWSNDSQPAKPDCQKVPSPCMPPPSKNKKFPLSLFICIKKRTLRDKFMSSIGFPSHFRDTELSFPTRIIVQSPQKAHKLMCCHVSQYYIPTYGLKLYQWLEITQSIYSKLI